MIDTPGSALKSALKRTLRGMGYEIQRIPHGPGPQYEPVRPKADYAPWNNDALFLETYNTVISHTLVDKYRCWELWTLVEQSQKLTGSLIEIGVWRGGTGALIASKAKLCGIGDPVYLCDTFRGVVKAGDRDASYRGGEHANTSREIVENLVWGRLGLDNTIILEGVFPDETAQRIREQPFRFCHIDVDVHRSAEDILEWIWPRLVLGGIVVYDDYGFRSCDGIARHVDAQRHLPDRLIIHNLNGHALLIKIR